MPLKLYLATVKINVMLQLEDTKDKTIYIYPVQRWINVGKHYYFYEFDALLPQDDKQIQERKLDLARKRIMYEFKPSIRGGPKLVRKITKHFIISVRITLY